MKLYEITKDIEELNNLVDSGAIENDEAVKETLDSMKLAIKQKGLNITALVLNEEASIDAMKEAERKIAHRRKQKEKKIEWLKSYLQEGMEANDITKIECADFVVSLAKCPPKVELIKDADILLDSKYGERFVRTKISKSVNKKAIAEALKEGEEIVGARLVQGNRLKFS